jgi:hypothetical protein
VLLKKGLPTPYFSVYLLYTSDNPPSRFWLHDIRDNYRFPLQLEQSTGPNPTTTVLYIMPDRHAGGMGGVKGMSLLSRGDEDPVPVSGCLHCFSKIDWR